MSWVDECRAAWLGVAICGACSVVGLHWWAGAYRARMCLRWFPALDSDPALASLCVKVKRLERSIAVLMDTAPSQGSSRDSNRTDSIAYAWLTITSLCNTQNERHPFVHGKCECIPIEHNAHTIHTPREPAVQPRYCVSGCGGRNDQ